MKAGHGPRPDGSSLLGVASRGVLWTGGAQFLGQTLHIVIRLILARLLVPADFGLVAMAMVFLSLTPLVTDLGVGNALTQRQELTEAHRSTAFWLTLAVALVLFIAFVVTAPWVGLFFREPMVVPIVRVLALSFLLGAPESIYAALLRRRFRFKILGLRRIVATAIGGACGIAAALWGLGVWALVLHTLVSTILGSALLAWQARWLPRLTFSRQAARELWGFGRWVTGSRLLNHANRTADNLLVGRFLGSTALGLYSFSYQAVLLPLTYVARPIASVSFPSFAVMQDDPPRCARAFLRTLELITVIAWPLAALGAFASPAVIPQVVGPEWNDAIPVFRLLSGVAALHAFMNLAAPLFDGLGHPGWGFRWTLLVLSLNLTGFVVGLSWGVTGVAAGLLAATILQMPCQWWILQSLLPLSFRQLSGLFLRGVTLFGATGGAWLLTDRHVISAETLPGLVAALFLTGILSLGAAFLLFPKARHSVRRILTELT